MSIRHATAWAALSLFAPLAAQAVGTPAGTNIQNTAQVTYSVGGSSTTTSSNTSSVSVAEILDVVVTVNAASVSATPGVAQQELLFTLTNTGNGPETFTLTPLSAGVGGDDFDPTLSSPAIYFDSDNSGDLSAPDVAYVAGANDPTLAADASVRVLVVNDIPASLADGQRGRSQLTAAANTGAGAPGTAFPGGSAGGLDAVVGSTGADAQEFGEYLIAGLQLSAVKSQSVVDQFGGARALPGARINYQIVVTASGSGTALGAQLTDLIPANTTYVAASLELNNTSLTDASDTDAGDVTTTGAPTVRVNLGDLTSASAPQTVEFAVRIN